MWQCIYVCVICTMSVTTLVMMLLVGQFAKMPQSTLIPELGVWGTSPGLF